MTPTPPKDRNRDEFLTELDRRIKTLEDVIFPPGGPALGAQLAALGDRIEAVQATLRSELQDLDARQTKKIEEAYEILAEVQRVIKSLAENAAGRRTMEA